MFSSQQPAQANLHTTQYWVQA